MRILNELEPKDLAFDSFAAFIKNVPRALYDAFCNFAAQNSNFALIVRLVRDRRKVEILCCNWES